MGYREEYDYWCTNQIFDEETKTQLKSLTDEKEIEDRFYKQLTFGTGGLRGILGVGINRMNIYTVGKATQGLANFINNTSPGGSVVIAYDSRIMSKEFALDSALILSANKIKVYLFESLRPTPELSFAVRYLNATAGIVITASHNPPQYNGYKVYLSDGGQIVPPYDKLIINEVNKISDYTSIKRLTEEEAKRQGYLQIIGEKIDKKYLEELCNLSLNKEILKEHAKELSIVYTPLNGTGNVPVRRLLKELGFEKVYIVPEQEKPDGDFPTLVCPNPEDKKAFEYALKLAKKVNADIVLATDPDADRLGVYAKDKTTGEYLSFSGNMSGILIAEYLLSQRREKGLLPENTKNGALITTIVSSKMGYEIAKEYGVTLIEVLTGFKYIGEQIKLFEDAINNNNGKLDYRKGAFEYLFGYEESCGCLVGTYARDKDAVGAVMMICEAAVYYRTLGLTLCDQMRNIYEKYGYYAEDIESVTLAGVDGAKKILNLMELLRKNCPKTLGGLKVLSVRDYLNDKDSNLPNSNVIFIKLENKGWCCVRPSGTEAKIKFYFGVKGKSLKDSKLLLSQIKQSIKSELILGLF